MTDDLNCKVHGMPDRRTVRVPEHVLTRPVDNELVLLNLDTEQYFGLDEMGMAMWTAVTTQATIGDAVDRLLEEFEVDRETLLGDVEMLLQKLSERGLVELSSS